MKKILLSMMMLSVLSCEKKETDKFEIENNINASVEIETKDVSHLQHAVYTVLEDGKLVVLFSQFDLIKLKDITKKSSALEQSIKLPNQIFYLGVYPAKEGVFPDLSKYQIGAINYNKIIFNPDLSISLGSSQKYMATHIIVDSTTPPIELGKYNININDYKMNNYISGEFNGALIKIDLETEQPDTTSPPILVSGNFEKAEYLDYERIKESLPIDISSLIK